jgi:hypothetical protein
LRAIVDKGQKRAFIAFIAAFSATMLAIENRRNEILTRKRREIVKLIVQTSKHEQLCVPCQIN